MMVRLDIRPEGKTFSFKYHKTFSFWDGNPEIRDRSKVKTFCFLKITTYLGQKLGNQKQISNEDHFFRNHYV